MSKKANPPRRRRASGDTSAPQRTARVGLRGAWWAAFLLAAVAVGAWGVANHPRYREWRFAHAALPELERWKDSEDPVALYYLGKRLNETGRSGEAGAILERAAQIDPSTARLRDEWAKAQLGTGAVKAAFNQLRQFTGTHPESAAGRLALGKFYVALRSLPRAREELEKAVALDPESGEAWFYLARARDTSAQYTMAAAREAAQKAVALNPEDADSHLLLALLLSRDSGREAARGEFAKAVSLAPSRADVRRQYARYLLDIGNAPGDMREAENQARAAVRAAPDDMEAVRILGLALMRNGKTAEALTPLRRAADGLPNDPVPAQKLREIYAAQGRAAESAEWSAKYRARQEYKTQTERLRQAISVRPDDADLRRRYARLLCLHGEAEACLRQYAAAEKTTIDAPDALNAAARDLREGGYAPLASSLARRAEAMADGPNPTP